MIISRMQRLKHWPLIQKLAGPVWGPESLFLYCANSTPAGEAPSAIWPMASPSTFHLFAGPNWLTWPLTSQKLIVSQLSSFFFFFFSPFLMLRLFFVWKALKFPSKAWGNIQQLFPFSLHTKFRGLFLFECQATLRLYKENCVMLTICKGRAPNGFLVGCDYSYGEKYSWQLASEDFHIASLVKLVLLPDPKISISLHKRLH